jgi:hypothetical protein
MKETGYDRSHAIKVFEDRSDPVAVRTYLVDGRHRYHAAKQLNFERVPAVVLRDPEGRSAEALRQVLVLVAHGESLLTLFRGLKLFCKFVVF